MKILLVSSRYAPHVSGGAERVAQTLVETLASLGHEPVVLTTQHGKEPLERTVGGVRVRAVPLRNVYDLSRKQRPRSLKPLWHVIDSWNPFMTRSVARIIQEERPDVIHTNLVTGFSPSVWSVARDAGVPVVHIALDHYVICARSGMAIDGVQCASQHASCALLSVPRVRAARTISAVIGPSEYVLRRHRQYRAFDGIPSFVIPFPCDLTRGPDEEPAARCGRGGPLRIGIMGRVEENKGVRLLLDAAARLPSNGWNLRIAGWGDPAFVAALQARYANPLLEFVGPVDPRSFLASLDLLVFPSLVPDTFGMSAAEALTMGVPVIASTRGALPEMIEKGRNGFLFDPDEEGSLDRVLQQAVRDPAGVRRLAAASIESAARFDPKSVTERYLDVYRSIRQ